MTEAENVQIAGMTTPAERVPAKRLMTRTLDEGRRLGMHAVRSLIGVIQPDVRSGFAGSADDLIILPHTVARAVATIAVTNNRRS